MTWKAIVYSATGTRHEQRGQPCQDYGSYRVKGSCVVGAVSDGAGSAKYAEVGAQLAVESALDLMEQAWHTHFGRPFDGDKVPSHADMEAIAPTFFTGVVDRVIAALQEKADQAGHELRDLNCTLLAFLATPDWVAAMQIGDGFIVMRSDTSPCQVLFEPSKGEFINETVFVTTEGAINHMGVCVHASKHTFLCAASDGLERVAIRMQTWEPFDPFFKPFEACLSQIPTQAEQEDYLKTFLESDRLKAKTDDDKTMLICLYQPDPGAQP